ncbi:MAG: HAD family hydrolase [Planctomycetes bacterium]|nr:HAD family hydrolase [Planctomycetota bacterium]
MDVRLPRFVAVDWNGTVVPWFGQPPYPEALTMLEALREAGVYLVVVSHATPQQIQADVARVGLVADEVHGVGAKASMLVQLADRYGDGVMVGDSPQDARAAQAAGLPFIQACFEGMSFLGRGLGPLRDWSELPLLLTNRPIAGE